MPAKRKSSGRKQTGKGALNAHHRSLGTPHGTMIQHPQYGTGFWDKLKGAWNWLRDTKIISTVAKAIPHPVAQTIGTTAGQLGLGRRHLKFRV